MSNPTWLRDHLIRTGAMTEKGVTRAVRSRHCRCALVILTGLTDDRACALEAIVDPRPLTALGEALALLEGRYTVTLRNQAGRFVLDDRNSFAIAGAPAGSRMRQDVHAEHRCGRPLPPTAFGPSTFPTATAPSLPPNSPCPF